MKNSYLLIAGVVVIVLIICLFAYRGWVGRLQKEVAARENVIELLQTEYNNALKQEENECE